MPPRSESHSLHPLETGLSYNNVVKLHECCSLGQNPLHFKAIIHFVLIISRGVYLSQTEQDLICAGEYVSQFLLCIGTEGGRVRKVAGKWEQAGGECIAG